MLDLIGGPMQSAMSTTFTWLSLIATAFEVLYRVRSYLLRRAARVAVKLKPARRRRALARSTGRKPVTVTPTLADRRFDRLRHGVTQLLARSRDYAD